MPDDRSPAPAAADGAPVVRADELAARLAARLCHDFISPASAIVSGLDLLEDPTAKDMRDDAMELISSSARKLVDLLSFSRIAFGASAAAESFDSAELERLSQSIFAHVRPELQWDLPPGSVNKAAARALLNLVQIAAGALPMGGLARAFSARGDDGALVLTIEARGARVRLHPEVLTGLKGQPLGEGLGGRWVQAYYLHALVTAAGGSVSAEVGDEVVTLTARTPG